MSSSKTSSYHLFRRWRGATFTKLGLLSESMSVATASKLVTPLAVLIPVLAALAEAQVLTDSAWWLTLGAIVVGVLLYWIATIGIENRQRYNYAVRSRKELTSRKIASASLSDYQREHDFEKREVDGRPYLASDRVDEFIQDGGLEKPWEFSSYRYRLPKDLEQFKYLNLRRHYAQGRAMFNGKLLGMACDPDWTSHVIQLHPIGYFDHITSNLVVDNLYYTPGYDELLFDGSSIIVNKDDGVLIDLIESKAANVIGSSTLVLTSDGHVIVGQQGSLSDNSQGMLIPSGSGSVSLNDSFSAETFADIVAGAAQREYFEEAAVPDAQEYLRKTKSTGVFRTPDSVTVPVPIATRPIAYMRDLTRAGLPDYFNLSYTQFTAEQAIGKKALPSEKGLQTGVRAERLQPGEDVARCVDRIVKDHRADGGSVSMQMEMTRHALLQMRERGVLGEFVSHLQRATA